MKNFSKFALNSKIPLFYIHFISNSLKTQSLFVGEGWNHKTKLWNWNTPNPNLCPLQNGLCRGLVAFGYINKPSVLCQSLQLLILSEANFWYSKLYQNQVELINLNFLNIFVPWTKMLLLYSISSIDFYP